MASTTRPKPLQIPVVDINSQAPQQSIADQLVDAAKIHGFVYIKNLGNDVSIKDIDHAFDLVLLSTLLERASLLIFTLVVQEVLCFKNRREARS